MKRLWVTLAAAVACTIATGCTTARQQIPRVIHEQAVAWNRGDIDAFMQPYWKSPDLTFSSARGVTRGWQTVYDGYKTRYPTRADMGTLTFSDLTVRELGPRAALVLGRWKIDRGAPIGGVFSLVWRMIDGRWVIVHDHTSADNPDPPPGQTTG
jgi:ketosteroid isomerase-like protein